MRSLTKKQKNILDEWYEKNKKELQIGIAFFDLHKCDLFGFELLTELEKINDFETISDEINRYVSDKGMAAHNG